MVAYNSLQGLQGLVVGEGKSLQVQALVNSALMENNDQLRLKLLEARRIEIEIRSAMSSVNVLNQRD
jgi:hypothetical protein